MAAGADDAVADAGVVCGNYCYVVDNYPCHNSWVFVMMLLSMMQLLLLLLLRILLMLYLLSLLSLLLYLLLLQMDLYSKKRSLLMVMAM